MLVLGATAAGSLVLSGCGNDGQGQGGDEGGDDDGSMTEGTGTGTDSVGDGDGDGDGDGEIHGAVGLSFYPADAVVDRDMVGVAGVYRLEPLDNLHDVYATASLGLSFPAPPMDADTVAADGIPIPFDWGRPSDWAQAGDGIAFEGEAGRLAACLFFAGVNADVPIYLAGDDPRFDPACQPDPARFVAGGDVQINLFGGEAFDTEVLTGLRNPDAFEVQSPDLTTLDFAIPRDQALDFAWDPPPDQADEGVTPSRMVIRVWDQNGSMVTAHAQDDGDFSIPAADLGTLRAGAATLTVTRERTEQRAFSGGLIDIALRYERWGYGELK